MAGRPCRQLFDGQCQDGIDHTIAFMKLSRSEKVLAGVLGVVLMLGVPTWWVSSQGNSKTQSSSRGSGATASTVTSPGSIASASSEIRSRVLDGRVTSPEQHEEPSTAPVDQGPPPTPESVPENPGPPPTPEPFLQNVPPPTPEPALQNILPPTPEPAVSSPQPPAPD